MQQLTPQHCRFCFPCSDSHSPVSFSWCFFPVPFQSLSASSTRSPKSIESIFAARYECTLPSSAMSVSRVRHGAVTITVLVENRGDWMGWGGGHQEGMHRRWLPSHPPAGLPSRRPGC